jgi:hypothetical protein
MSNYYSDQVCEDYAVWQLKRYATLSKEIVVTSTQMFHIVENELITVQRNDKPGNPVERHVVTGFTRPIGQTGTMSINCISVNDFPSVGTARILHTAQSDTGIVGFSTHVTEELVSVKVGFDPVQSGSGDPSPSNVRPISGWTGVKLTRSGTNVISPAPAGDTELNGVTFTSNGDGTYKIKGTASAYTTFVVNVEPFTIPISVAKGGNGVMALNNSFVGVSGVGIGFYYNSTIIDTWGLSGVNRVSNGYSAMGGKLCNKWSISVPSGASVDGTIAPVFRSDGVNTSGFVPFTGYDVVEVTWQSEAGTVYGGTLDVSTGVLTINKVCVTIDGATLKADGITKYGQNYRTTTYYTSGLAGKYTSGTTFCMSDKMLVSIAYTVSNPGNATKICVFPHSTGILVTFPADTGITTRALADAWFVENTPIVCYELVTPSTVQLTAQQITALRGDNTVWHSMNGGISVEYYDSQ